mmetsp:Transcript_5504/g.12004  ORF Transcript_5504/g.12004 Transcript_5504/m.12004 type:complete len:140 (-) Transcript_5504:307-726(-)
MTQINFGSKQQGVVFSLKHTMELQRDAISSGNQACHEHKCSIEADLLFGAIKNFFTDIEKDRAQSSERPEPLSSTVKSFFADVEKDKAQFENGRPTAQALLGFASVADQQEKNFNHEQPRASITLNDNIDCEDVDCAII